MDHTNQPSTTDTDAPTVTSDPANFAMIPHWLIGRVKPTAVVTYLALRTWADNSTGHAFPRLEMVAQRAGVSHNTVTAAIKELVSVGAVEVIPRYREDGGRMSNSYHLCSPTAPDPQAEEPQEHPPTTPQKLDGGHPPKTGGYDPPKTGGTITRLKELDSLELEPSPGHFDKFWQLAVRKTGKGAARKAFQTALQRTTVDTLGPAWVEANAAWATWPDRTKVPHPATWLNQDRWDDDPPEPAFRARGKTEQSLADATLTPDEEQALLAAINGETGQRQIGA